MVGRDDYALKAGEAGEVSAPDLDYLPPHPARPHRTALIGAGGFRSPIWTPTAAMALTSP